VKLSSDLKLIHSFSLYCVWLLKIKSSPLSYYHICISHNSQFPHKLDISYEFQCNLLGIQSFPSTKLKFSLLHQIFLCIHIMFFTSALKFITFILKCLLILAHSLLVFKLSPRFKCHVFFWVVPRCLEFKCQRLFHLHRQVGTDLPMKMEKTVCSKTLAFELQIPGKNPK
jgi:hypothetical protein